MYNLSPRFAKKGSTGCTPPTVGPNTYILCDKDFTLKNRAPFLSSSERKFSIGKKVYTQALYNPEEAREHRIKGGASLNYTEIRIKPRSSGTPAPGTYEPKKPTKGYKYIPPPRHGNGRIYYCRVPYTIYSSAPSIPTEPRDENGYDLTIYNDIIKVPPNFRDHSRGPACYSVPGGELCYTTKRYKGTNWSISRTQRYRNEISTTPGPDAYDVGAVKICKPKEKDEEYRGFARLLSFIPRYTEAQMMRAEKQDLPGPGYYDVKSSAIDFRPSLSINPRPLIAGAKRFQGGSGISNPSPCEYDVTNCDKEKRYFSTKDVPFGFEALRFPERKGDQKPGPQTYNVKGPLDEKLQSKFNKYTVVDVPFCSTTQRMKSKSSAQMPGPDSYDVGKRDIEKEPIHASVFRSRTSRFQHKCPSEEASPASYNITDAFNQTHNRMSGHAGKVPFLTSAKRLASSKEDKPGPADYLGQREMDSKGLKFGTATRFRNKLFDTPSPGQYTIHPAYDLSIYRAIGTHNLRLKENVVKTKLRQHPKATAAAWASGLKKDKKLKWFEKTTDQAITVLAH